MASRVISAVLTMKDKDFSSGVKKASSSMTDFQRKSQQAANDVNKFTSSAAEGFGKLAKGAAGLAAVGIGAIAGAAAGTFVEMDTAFATLSARTGATGAELEQMESTVKDVFKKGYGESIDQVANDMAVLRQNLGEVDDKTLESTQILGKLTENADINSVAGALRSMTSSFPGATQQQSLDLITRTLQVGGDASGDLLDTFNEYSGVVSAAGIGMDTFANIMVNGAKAGARNYDVVADTLKEFNIRAKDGSKTTAEGFEAIGLNASEMGAAIAEGGTKGEEALYKTFEALGKIEDPVKRNEAGVALMGTKFEDLEWQTVQAMGAATDQLGKFEGATAEAGEKIESGFGFKMNKMWSNIKTGVAEAFEDAGGGDLLDGLIATAEQTLIPTLDTIVTKAVEVATSIKDNWSNITGFISPLLPVIAGVAGALIAYQAATTAVTIATTVWKGVTTVATVAAALLNGTLLLSPLTWVAIAIGAVIAVGVLLYQNWETVTSVAGTLWTKVKEVFGGIYDWGVSKIQPVVDFFKGLADSFSNFTKKISNFKLPDWVSTVGSKISGAVSAINGSHATGLNRVPFNGYVAELHKDEMVIPARESERLRAAGITIDNIDRSVPIQRTTNKTTNSSTVTNKETSKSLVIEKFIIQGTGKSTDEILNEFVPKLKLKLANI